MGIISISIDRESSGRIGKMMGALGIRSRSKLIRASLDAFAKEHELLSELKGIQTVVLIVSKKKGGADVSRIMHGFQKIIKTSIHHHTRSGCLDVLITEGDAGEIRRFYTALANSGARGSVSASVV